MTKQTGFNPDGNLIVRGSIYGDNDLVITGNASISGNLHVTGSSTANVTLDTIVQNNADGYVIDYNDNANVSYYQFGSAGARLTWDGANLTVALANGSPIATSFVGTTDFSDDVTITGTLDATTLTDGTASITGGVGTGFSSITATTFSGTATSATGLTQNIAINLSNVVTGSGVASVQPGGAFTATIPTSLTPNIVTLGYHTSGDYVATVADAGNGTTVITGSGPSAAVTIDLSNTTVTPGSYGSSSNNTVVGFTVDEKGRITQANANMIAISSSQITNFESAVEALLSVTDAGGDGSLTYSNGVFTYTGPSASEVRAHFTAGTGINISSGSISTNDGAIVHDSLSGFVANEHIDHSAVSITAGSGLTGGGTIAATRTLNVGAGDGITVNADNVAVNSTVVRTSGDQTIAGVKTFTGTVDLSGATVSDTRLVRTDTDATLANSYTYTGTIDLTGATATASTQANTDNSANLATTAYVKTAISDLINGADTTLDTLGEIASALSNNQSVATAITTQISDAEANIVIVGNDRISRTGNIAMEADFNANNNQIINLITPTLPHHAVTLGYFDNYANVATDATSNIKTYIDDTRVGVSDTLRSEFFKLTTTANSTPAQDGTIYYKNFNDDDIVITPALDTSNIAEIRPLIVKGRADALTSTQQHIDSVLHLRGDVVFDPGLADNTLTDWSNAYANPGNATFYNNVNFVKNSNTSYAATQFVAYNTDTYFFNGNVGFDANLNPISSAMLIQGSNILMATLPADVSTYLVANSSGNISTSGANTSLTLGVPRAHRQTFSDSTMYIGNFANITQYTNVIYNSNTFTTGLRPLERLTVDGAIIVGPKSADDSLLVNGTIYYDGTSMKIIEGGEIKPVSTTATASIGYTGNLWGNTDVVTGAIRQIVNESTPLTISDTFSASVTSNTITLTTGNANIVPGMFAEGTGIPAGTTVSSVNSSSNIVLSTPVTVTSGDPVTFKGTTTYYITAIQQGTGLEITHSSNQSANVMTISANLDVVAETARGNISVTDSGGDGSLGYNSGTGVFTYTGPSQAEANARIDAAPDNVRAHFSGGYGVDITSGVVETANADIRGLFSASGDLAYNASTGVFSFTNDLGDIESVTAGNGLTGGGTSGNVTLNVAGGYGITVNADDIELTNSSVRGLFSGTGLIGYDSGTGAISTTADNYSSWKFTTDTAGNVDITSGSLLSIVGDGNVNVTHSGSTITISSNADINSVVAGSGLTGGGSVGAVTLNIGAGSGITVNADNVAVDSTVVRTTGTQTVAGEKTFSNDADFAADVIIEGNLTVNGTTTTINATTLSVDDNMIYLNANSNTTNIDIGFAGNYNDGTYAHAGFFRDTTDGYWKVFDSYTPEPDAAVDIDTSHASFALADMRADTFRGNLVVPGQYSLPTTDGTASQVLTTDGNGTVSFTNVSAIGLTSVTGGDGLTATPGVGSVDLDVGAGPGITVNADNVAVNVAYVRSQFSAGGDLSYNASTGVFSFTNDAGDIESVTAGSGLTGGGTSGAVTLNVGAGTGITVTANEVSISQTSVTAGTYGSPSKHVTFSVDAQGRLTAASQADIAISSSQVSGLAASATTDTTNANNISSGTLASARLPDLTVADFAGAAIQTGSEAFADSDTVLMTAAAVQDKIESYGYSTTTGDITGVTAGFGLTGGGTSGTVSLALANASVRSLFSASGDLSYNSSTGVFSFTNDAGDIEAVTAGAGLTGGGTSGAVTLNIGAGTGITVNPDNVAVTLSPFSTTNLSEGTNQYYTVARANSAIDARVTTSFVNALNVNATTLDTLDSTAFLRSNADDTHSSNIAPSATNTYSLGTSGAKYANVWATTFQGTATSAQYADLAEKYESDGNYSAGTVVVFGGEKEITTTDVAEDHRVAGIISTDPAFMMNSDSDGQYVALRGRVPCKVIGPVAKGDVLVTSHRPGLAMASSDPKSVPSACIVGKAISSLESPTEGIVEVVV